MGADSEIVKIALQGGMFGLWAIFIVWLLFYGAPMLTKTLEKMASDSREVIEKISCDHKQALEDSRKECLEERMAIFKAAADERERERDSRHEFRNTIQELIAHSVRPH